MEVRGTLLRPEGLAFSSHVREGVDQRLLKTMSTEGAEPGVAAKEVSARGAYRGVGVPSTPSRT
jgi:hypothetical protein